MNKHLGHILMAGLSAMPCSLSALNVAPMDSVVHREVKEVSVVAFRQSNIIPSQRLDGQQLQRLNACSVADAVRYFAGVQIKDYGGVGGLKTVDVRSMGSNHLGVFYDGLQIGNAQNGIVDLGKFSLDNMEEVILYNGEKGDVLQSAKDFGTSNSIYLRSRRPRFLYGSRINVGAKMRWGSFGLRNPSVTLDYKLGEKVTMSVNGEIIRANGRYKFRYHKVLEDETGKQITVWDTTGTRQNGDIDAKRVEWSLFGSSDKGMWHTKLYYYDSERGLPRAIVRNVWTSAQRQWDRDFFAQASYQTTSSDLHEHRISAKYSVDYMRYLNPDTTMLYVDNRFTQQAVYTSLANSFHLLSFWDASVSADYERNWLDSDMAGFPYPVRNTILVSAASSLNFLIVKVNASLLSNNIHDKTALNDRQNVDRWTRRVTPSVSLSINPFVVPITLRAYYKKSFRMPTFNDLYYTDMGNISLEPENARQMNVGFTYSILSRRSYSSNILSISADTYHNRITNKIVAVPKGNSQYRWMMMNIGKVDIRGIDISANMKQEFFKVIALTTRVTYTYQKALDVTDPTDDGPRGTYRGQISYIPRHSGSAVAGLQLGPYGLDYSFIYVGERYHVSANIPANYEPAWYTHDIRVSRFSTIGRVRINCSFEANNLLNQQYDVVLNYPMPGRNYKGILTINI